MNNMRHWIGLCESDADIIPRLWLGPRGEAIDVDDEDGSHSSYVLQHPDTFGLTDDIRRYQQGADLAYDIIIAQVEANGWIRISRDTSGRQGVVISASNARNISRGIRWLQDHSFAIHEVQAEIETVVGDTINHRFYHLVSDELETFLRRGTLPRPQSSYTL